MARDVQIFDITVPRGGTAAVPQSFAMLMPPRIITRMQIMVPAGVRSSVHFAIGSAGTRVIPSNPGAYITGDDEVIDWPLAGYHDSGNWTFFAFNSGGFPHTIQVRFLCELVQTVSSTAPVLLSSASLSNP